MYRCSVELKSLTALLPFILPCLTLLIGLDHRGVVKPAVALQWPYHTCSVSLTYSGLYPRVCRDVGAHN